MSQAAIDRPIRWRVLAGIIGLLFAGSCEQAPPEVLRAGSVRESGDGSGALQSTEAVPEWKGQIAAIRAGLSTAIRASGRPVSAEEWADLSDGCERLRVLEANVSLLTAGDLAVLATLPALEQLKLTGPVDDAAMSMIVKAAGLRTLNLPDGEFSDEGLAALRTLSRLELLRFGSPGVGDAGLELIASLPAIRFLHLLDVPITDAGLRHLYPLERLESFYLDGGQCTDAGLRELLRRLPDLHFHRDQIHLPGDEHDHD